MALFQQIARDVTGAGTRWRPSVVLKSSTTACRGVDTLRSRRGSAPGDEPLVTVEKWSGIEARALRLARRMSVRQFARHLGFNDAAVAHWESRGAQARLRYHTQE